MCFNWHAGEILMGLLELQLLDNLHTVQQFHKRASAVIRISLLYQKVSQEKGRAPFCQGTGPF